MYLHTRKLKEHSWIDLLCSNASVNPIDNNNRLMLTFSLLVVTAIICFWSGVMGEETKNGPVLDLRKSPVSYHMSFDDRDFFEEDFIECSGKKSINERNIDFPPGKFG